MNKTLELCRCVYNETLATRKNAWEQERKSISNYETHNMLPSWKAQRPELTTVHSQVLQEVQQRVDLAFKAFFRRVKAGDKKAGYPRFKGKGRYDSFTYPQLGFKLLENLNDDSTVRISKIGNVKIKLHRVLDRDRRHDIHGEQGGRSWLSRGHGRPYKYYASVFTVRGNSQEGTKDRVHSCDCGLVLD